MVHLFFILHAIALKVSSTTHTANNTMSWIYSFAIRILFKHDYHENGFSGIGWIWTNWKQQAQKRIKWMENPKCETLYIKNTHRNKYTNFGVQRNGISLWFGSHKILFW